MFEGIRIFLVVPAFNEAPRVGRMLSKVPPFVDSVYVIDDASTDPTSKRVLEWSESDTRITLLQQPSNSGVGAAIVRGYRECLSVPPIDGAKDAFVVMAADDQMDPLDLPALLAPIRQGADYVKGERFSEPSAWRTIPLQRRIGGEMFSLLTSFAAKRRFHDTQCGYTAITRDACTALPLDEIYSGFGYPNDMLLKLSLMRRSIVEVPVRPVYADEESKLRLRHLSTIVRIIAAGAKPIWLGKAQDESAPKATAND